MADASKLRLVRNELITTVNAAWLGAPAIVGIAGPYPPLVIAAFDGDGNSDDNRNRKPWARMRVQHTTGQSTSISGRSYKNVGTVTVNVFVDRQRSNASNVCELVGDSIKLALRRHRGIASTKDVVLRERPINNNYSQVDVSAGFWWMEFTGAQQ